MTLHKNYLFKCTKSFQVLTMLGYYLSICRTYEYIYIYIFKDTFVNIYT